MVEKDFGDKLEHLEVPEVELPGYRGRLKKALLSALSPKITPRPAWRFNTSFWRAWRPALVGLATVAILILVVAVPLLQHPQTPSLSAIEIALADPEVQATFTPAEMQTVTAQEMGTDHGQTLVLLSANSGVSVMVGVDIVGKKVSEWLLGSVSGVTQDQLIFSSNMSGLYSIYVVNRDGTGLTKLTDDRGNYYSPAWSPQRQQIAFVSDFAGYYALYLMNADGTNITKTAATSLSYLGFPGGWSPDGSRLVFTSAMTGSDIYSVGGPYLDQNLTKLTYSFENMHSTHPVWSPDGAKIAFIAYHRNATGLELTDPGLWVMNADGSDKHLLTEDTDGFCWSPDSQRLAFGLEKGSDTSTDEICTMKADGTGLTQLTDNDVRDYGPAWSPDGSKIAFVSKRGGSNVICTMNADGTGQTLLSDNTAPSYQPQSMPLAWTPDGTAITYFMSSNRENATKYNYYQYELFIMNADGTGQRKLASGDVSDFPAWATLASYPTPTVPQNVKLTPLPITAAPQTSIYYAAPRAPNFNLPVAPPISWPVKFDQALAKAMSYLPASAAQGKRIMSYGWSSPGWGIGEPFYVIRITGLSITQAELGWPDAGNVAPWAVVQPLPITAVEGAGPYTEVYLGVSGLTGNLRYKFAFTTPPKIIPWMIYGG